MKVTKLTVETAEVKANYQDPMEKIEEALLLCRFGRFNIKLLVAALTIALAQTTALSTSSFILPNAECDLHMSYVQKGVLNAASSFGMLSTIAICGFLSNAFGRRTFLIGGSLGMGLCCILEGSSQKYWMLVLWKFLEGIGSSLANATSTVMVAEFTHKDARDKTLVCFMLFSTIAHVVVNLLAWLILTRSWYFSIWNGYFELHSWNIFLYISSIWSILAAVQYYFLPESPKFLLLNGQCDKALEVLVNMFEENTGKSKEHFPIKSLTNSIQKDKNKMALQLREALYNSKYLFRQPAVKNLCLLSIIGFISFSSMSFHRLWYPQLSTLIEAYQKENNGTAKFCPMIDRYMKFQNYTEPNRDLDQITTCVPKLSSAETYLNTLIINLTSCLFLVMSAFLVDHVGQKYLSLLSLMLSGVFETGLYWVDTPVGIAGILAMIVGFVVTAVSLLKSTVVRIFPTTLRTLALSIVITVARSGSLTGNILFPVTLGKSCLITFGAISFCCIAAALLVFFLPNPTKENRETGDK